MSLVPECRLGVSVRVRPGCARAWSEGKGGILFTVLCSIRLRSLPSINHLAARRHMRKSLERLLPSPSAEVASMTEENGRD